MSDSIWCHFQLPQTAECLPSGDLASLAGLTRAADIQAWTRAKADEYRKFALVLLSVHNQVAPIHHLPTEILELILGNWIDHSSLRLLHVCQRWRSILLDRPTFWADAIASSDIHETRVIKRDEVPYIKTMLQLSAPQPIQPRFVGFPKTIIKTFMPFVMRLTSLDVTVGSWDLSYRLWPALCSGMPNLRTLCVQFLVTQEDLDGYPENRDTWLHGITEWGSLAMLSADHLPALTRLVCPHNLL